MSQDDILTVIGRDGKAHRLDDRNPPHVYRDGEDNGVATQTEEALWPEVVSLRKQLAGAVEAIRAHRDEFEGPGAPCLRDQRLWVVLATLGGQ